MTGPGGALRASHFKFNGWGEKFKPYDSDAKVGALIAGLLHAPVYSAPLVLEGGAVSVDGEGTLLTTEQCLLNPNRNPGMTKADVEAVLRDYLGAEYVANGGIVVPLSGNSTMDDEALAIIGKAFPDRKVVGLTGPALAAGGGGVHCITQQVPAEGDGVFRRLFP